MTNNNLVLPVYKPFWIGQGFDSSGRKEEYVRSHTVLDLDGFKADDRYSLDFCVKEGSPLLATKSGIIHEVFVDSNENHNGIDPEEAIQCPVNYFVIDHEDGTHSLYFHLMKNGIAPNKEGERLLQMGDQVEQGQLIGYSGNTGWSIIPHLHYSLIEEGDWTENRKSIPFSFKNYNGPLTDKEICKQWPFIYD